MLVKLSEEGGKPGQRSRGAEGQGRSPLLPCPLAPLHARKTDGLNFTEKTNREKSNNSVFFFVSSVPWW